MPAFEQRSENGPVLPSGKSKDSSISNPVYIAGVVVVLLMAIGAGIWLGKRYWKKRHATQSESKDLAFLSVKGLVPEGQAGMSEKPLQHSPSQKTAFSRENLALDGGITMPEKTLPPRRPGPGASRQEIIDYHRQSNMLPNSFSAKPFSFAMGTGSPRSSVHESKRSSPIRSSFISLAQPGQNRYSVFSVLSTTSGASEGQTIGAVRKVRQLFEPVLPDELLLTKVGEQFTIVQSFDDGWCVVGRDGGSKLNAAKSLFKSSPQQEDNVELGVIPAWCFLKPVKGLRAERPMRGSSLGITVNMDGPASRNDLMSWSNF